MNNLKYQVQKLINNEEDILKILNEGIPRPTAREFSKGRLSALHSVLIILKKNLTNSK